MNEQTCALDGGGYWVPSSRGLWGSIFAFRKNQPNRRDSYLVIHHLHEDVWEPSQGENAVWLQGRMAEPGLALGPPPTLTRTLLSLNEFNKYFIFADPPRSGEN